MNIYLQFYKSCYAIKSKIYFHYAHIYTYTHDFSVEDYAHFGVLKFQLYFISSYLFCHLM